MNQSPTQEPPMSENEKLREALEAWSKSIIMSDGEREIPIADIWAGYGGDVQHAAKLTREALSTPPSKADAGDVERIKHMVDRFLMWRLPPDFAPDGGVIFSHTSGGRVNEPIGTNLLTAVQAEAMVRFMVEGLPAIQNRDARLREALDGFGDDYITSETHHPNWVLIPTKTFDRIRAALQMGGEKP